MTCDEIQESISTMLDGELSDEVRASILAHIAVCPECRNMYEAFSALSDSLQDLEDVPENFTETVMHRIQAKAKAPKRKRWLTGAVGLAACLALVLFAGRTLNLPAAGDNNAAPQNNDESIAITEKAMPYTDDSGDISARLMSFDSATVYQNSIAPAVEAVASPTDAITGAETNKLVDYTFSGEVSNAPLNTVPPESLDSILTVSVPADYGNFDRMADYTVVLYSGEETYSINIWIEGERLYCQDDATENAYYAEGTYAQLLTLIEE